MDKLARDCPRDVLLGAALAQRLEERRRPLGRVELAVRIQRCRRGEPCGGLVRATSRRERIGVRVPEPDCTGTRSVPIETAAGEHGQCSIQLTEITSRTGHHDQQLDPRLAVKSAHSGIAEHPRGLLRAPERTLTISDDRKVARVAGNPSRSAQFGECLGPFARVIGGDADRFAHGRHARRARSGGPGERQRASRVGVDELPGSYEVLRNGLRVQLAE